MPVRDRANVVCVQCHARKVKCNLQASDGHQCANCLRAGQICVRRYGMRKRRKIQSEDLTFHSSYVTEPTKEDSNQVHDAPSCGPSTTDTAGLDTSTSISTTHRRQGFISHTSVLSCDGLSETTLVEASLFDANQVQQAILQATKATILPEPALFHALVDSFAENLFHSYPVVEQRDLESPRTSILLGQALCLAGSVVRHGTESSRLSHSLYQKVKVLINANHEADHVQVLKALCMMSCWSSSPPHQISLDGPWHWSGIATRLAVQMGLHQEVTYSEGPQSQCLRRIFWHLYSIDKLQVACWGRPPLLQPKDFDVRVLSIADFEVDDIQARISLHTTRICATIGDIADLILEKRPIDTDPVAHIVSTLCNWISSLPVELQLYANNGKRRPFYRPVAELFIKYFVAIILLQSLTRPSFGGRKRMSTLSIIASSCIVGIYEEIYHREQTNFLLPIHGFFCMAAAVPLIYYRPKSPHRNSLREKQINILRLIMERMRLRYGGADMVLRRIDKLNKAAGDITSHDVAGPSLHLGPSPDFDRAADLFPFPASICDDMDLLELSASSHDQFIVDNLVPVGDMSTAFYFDEIYNFSGMEFSDMGATQVDSGSLSMAL